MWSDIVFRLRALTRCRAVEAELDEELQDHLEHLVEQHVRRGMTPDEALRAARLELGGVDQIKEECRDARGVSWIETVWRDLAFGLRLMRKNPGFAAICMATLALGIGVTTAVFSAVNAMLFRPIPIPQMNRVVYAIALREYFDPYGSGLVDFAAYRDRAHSFTSIGLSRQAVVNLIDGNEAEALRAGFIDAGYLKTLAVAPIVGRAFSSEDCRPGGARVALISHGLWERRFARNPQIIGAAVDLDGSPFTIIGVMPSFFDLPASTAIWLPLQINQDAVSLQDRTTHEYGIIGRLKPDVSLQQANAEVKAVSRQTEQELPQFRRNWGVTLVTLRQQLMDDLDNRSKRSILILFAAVGLVFLICCANVASLLLARGVAREQEIAMRSALGATSRRIAAQLVSEGWVLALFGGVAGLLLAFAIVPLFVSLNPIQTFALSGLLVNFHIDAYALAFVGLLVVAVVVLCPLLPALKSAKSRDLTSLIGNGPQRGNTGSGRPWLSALVVAEIAIAVPLLVAGALFYRSFQALQRLDLGFLPDHLLTMHLALSPDRYRDFSKREEFVHNVVQKVQALPGVLNAGFTTNIPLTANSRDSAFTVEGHPVLNLASLPMTSHRLVSADYLQTLGVVLVKGRFLNDQDRAGSMPAVVISEELAREGWQGEDPIGKHVRRGGASDTQYPWLTVVGVVRNPKEDRDNFRIDRPVWYLPFDQQPNSYPLNLAVRTATNPAEVSDAVRKAIYSVDPLQGVSEVSTMESQVAIVLSTDRFGALLLGSLAAIGLALSAVGLYGVLAYLTRGRTREIAIRMALGASPRQVLTATVAQGAALAGTGLALGLLGSFAMTGLLSRVLFGVHANNPAVLAAVTTVLAVTALLACSIPAWQATKVDPTVALR